MLLELLLLLLLLLERGGGVVVELVVLLELGVLLELELVLALCLELELVLMLALLRGVEAVAARALDVGRRREAWERRRLHLHLLRGGEAVGAARAEGGRVGVVLVAVAAVVAARDGELVHETAARVGGGAPEEGAVGVVAPELEEGRGELDGSLGELLEARGELRVGLVAADGDGARAPAPLVGFDGDFGS